MKQTLLHLVIAALTGGAFVSAADVPTQPLGTKDALVFSDDFERADLGPTLKSTIPAFTVADGVLKGRQERSDHGGTLGASLPLPNGNVILELKFRFAGARSFNVACDDIQFKGTHAGHISRVTVQPNRITLYDDKEGVMRNDIYALRKSGDPKKLAEGDRMSESATVKVPVKLEQGRWYRLDIEIVGDQMRVTLDDKAIGHLKSSGLAHATKPNLRLSAWGKEPTAEAHFDELRIWSVKKAAERK
ncbi:MAG: hypothetical protein Q8M07_15790 [Prosthecobacter sp.]|nr:hypothetical protein [Prosthecobacter sp.]